MKNVRKIIVFGSLNMDLSIEADQMPKTGETIDGHSFFTAPGGKGGNQAVAAAKSGAQTYMIASVGQDFFGKQLISSLTENQVDCSYITEREEASTGVAVIVRSQGDNRIILNAGANHCVENKEISNALQQIANKEDIFLTQFENKQAVVLEALKEAKSRGLFTVLNPAPAKAIPSESYKYIDLIIVNQSECELLTNIYPTTEEECKKAMAILFEAGVHSAIITLGVDGSIYGQATEFIFVSSYSVKAVDTTAAGDSYIGTFLYKFSNGDTIAESMNYASKASALAVTKQGAQPSIPSIDEIVSYFKEEN